MSKDQIDSDSAFNVFLAIRHPEDDYSVYPSAVDSRLMAEICRVTEMFDVKLLIQDDDEPIMAHRMILVLASKTCRAYFLSSVAKKRDENGLYILDLPQVDKAFLKKVIGFLYTHELGTLTLSNVRDLLKVATLLQVQSVINVVVDFLLQSMCTNNVLSIWRLARDFPEIKLEEQTFELINKEFSKVSLNEEFLFLSVDELLILLHSEYLNVDSEETVFKAALRWVDESGSGSEFVDKVFEHVRFELLSNGFLRNTVLTTPILRDSSKIQDSIDQVFNYHKSRKAYGQVTTLAKCRVPSNLEPSLLMVGEQCQFYGIATNQLFYASQTAGRRRNASVLTFDRKAYAFGGKHSQNGFCLDSVEVYSSISNSWSIVNGLKLSQPKTSFGVAELNGNVFVAGGQSSNRKQLKMVEMVDLFTGTISALPPLSMSLTDFPLVTSNNALYLLGGRSSKRANSAILRCDPREGSQWRRVTEMLEVRHKHAAVAWGPSILVTGGQNTKQNLLRSAERFDPRANKCDPFKDMIEERHDHTLFVHEDSLYAAFGPCFTSSYYSVERFRTKFWEYVEREVNLGPIPYGRSTVYLPWMATESRLINHPPVEAQAPMESRSRSESEGDDKLPGEPRNVPYLPFECE